MDIQPVQTVPVQMVLMRDPLTDNEYEVEPNPRALIAAMNKGWAQVPVVQPAAKGE